MRTLADIQAELRGQLPYLRERYHIESLGVFGSFARGDQTEESDIDLLVSFSATPDLLEYIDLAEHLETVLGHKVDLVTWDALEERKGMKSFVLRNLAQV